MAGVLVLGAVQEIRDFDVSVSLPGNMCGTVAIGNVSDLLTEEMLEEIVEADEEDTKKVGRWWFLSNYFIFQISNFFFQIFTKFHVLALLNNSKEL